MASQGGFPQEVLLLESPQRVEHVVTATGGFRLEIDHCLPGEAAPLTLRVSITERDIVDLLAALEGTRRRFSLPLPPILQRQQQATRPPLDMRRPPQRASRGQIHRIISRPPSSSGA
jgi:hypothetical protein